MSNRPSVRVDQVHPARLSNEPPASELCSLSWRGSANPVGTGRDRVHFDARRHGEVSGEPVQPSHCVLSACIIAYNGPLRTFRVAGLAGLDEVNLLRGVLDCACAQGAHVSRWIGWFILHPVGVCARPCCGYCCGLSSTTVAPRVRSCCRRLVRAQPSVVHGETQRRLGPAGRGSSLRRAWASRAASGQPSLSPAPAVRQ